jgi:hypothetical protein
MKLSTKVSYCIVFESQLTTLPAAEIMPHRMTVRYENTELETAHKEAVMSQFKLIISTFFSKAFVMFCVTCLSITSKT